MPHDNHALDLDRLRAFRHDLHRYPELRYQEHRTAEKISQYLTSLGIVHVSGIASTGIVASVHGKSRSAANPGPAIGIRADMDALPLQESNAFDHASAVPGCMHACGHDGHTTMLLGAAALLAANRDFDGTVHLIFQPAEEGGAGARAMLDEQLFERFPCQAVFALHNWPALPQGQMAVRVGPIMAAAQQFGIIVKGRGGHAALPHETVDPLVIACFIVTQLQTLVSRRVDPLQAAVLTIGRVEAGTSANIIPGEARIQGTCRSLDNQVQRTLLEGIERVACLVAQAHGATAEVVIKPGGYPVTDNHADQARLMGQVMAEVVGEDHVDTHVAPAMTSEDFAFMLQEVPGAYGWIGNGHAEAGLHHPEYDFNDENLSLGARFWDRLARRWFERA